jgi:hypothetical protein
MLRAYCKHVDAGERFGERYTALLDEGPPRGGGGVALYWEAVDKLGDRYERETRLMTHLASKLRIAKMQRQSGYKDEVELRNATKKRMWEEDPA